LPHFENSVILRILFTPIDIVKKKSFVPYLVTFFLFGLPITHFRIGRHEKKKKKFLL
jgi:hypothetical protein